MLNAWRMVAAWLAEKPDMIGGFVDNKTGRKEKQAGIYTMIAIQVTVVSQGISIPNIPTLTSPKHPLT